MGTPKKCAYCGTELGPEDNFCSQCGAGVLRKVRLKINAIEGKKVEISTTELISEAIQSLFRPKPVIMPPSAAVYRNRPPKPMTKYIVIAVLLTVTGLYAGYGKDWMRYIGLTIGGYAAPIAYLTWIFQSDRYEKEPLSLIIYIFGWGAFAGILSSILNTFFSIPLFGPPGAALVEEPLKILGVYLLAKGGVGSEINDHLDGMVYGAAAGAGFAGLENLYYIMQRSTTAVAHIAWSAMVGRSLGMAKAIRGELKLFDLIPGLLVVIPLHFLWNFLPPLIGLGTILPLITYALTRQVEQALKDEESWGFDFQAPDESLTP
jgi:RsiW-degrading membrane proteinase PrsW (M82 family)